jgi:hypothetical protein
VIARQAAIEPAHDTVEREYRKMSARNVRQFSHAADGDAARFGS